MSEIAALEKGNFAELAKSLGLEVKESGNKMPTILRLDLQQKNILGKKMVEGEEITAEVVKAGSFRIEEPVANGKKIYAEKVSLRPLMQQLYYKRFVKGEGSSPNRFIKSLMADSLEGQLKDTEGGFDCGRPKQFYEDWNNVPEKIKNLIKGTKRTRVIFGMLTVGKAKDEKGNSVSMPDPVEVMWEISNRDAFFTTNKPFIELTKKGLYPFLYNIKLSTEAKHLPNGDAFYLPKTEIDYGSALKNVQDGDQQAILTFKEYKDSHNSYVLSKWKEKHREDVDDDTKQLVDDFIDVSPEEAA